MVVEMERWQAIGWRWRDSMIIAVGVPLECEEARYGHRVGNDGSGGRDD